MRKSLYIMLALFTLGVCNNLKAGNPDRQGEAGAYELVINPWARSAGLHALNTASVLGVEAIRLNIAGLSFVNNTEIVAARTQYLRGTNIYLNTVGLAQKVGKNGVIGFNLMAMDLGEIPITTVQQPEGNGGLFSPNFTNLSIGYSHLFGEKIAVGAALVSISENASDVRASGLAMDAGIQYTNENVRIGISLRNIGTPLRFQGEGLSIPVISPNGQTIYTVDQRAARYELPTVLNLGASYDFELSEQHKMTAVANFASNSFSRDEAGLGLEYNFNDTFMARVAYKRELGLNENIDIAPSIYTGLAAGVSLQLPLDKDNPNNKVGLDISYQQTSTFDGNFNVGLRLSL
jgi:hypothetical protein